MKCKILFVTMVIAINQLYSQGEDKLHDQYLDLTKIKIEKNSDFFKIDTIDNEQVLTLTGNAYNQEIDEFTGKKKDDARGKVVLFGDKLGDYSMTVGMKFLGFHVENFPTGGWFGFALRAQNFENYEIVWFMPAGGGESNTVALYLLHME